MISSSKNIEDYYSEAFQIDKQKIKALGLPRLDYYFENHDLNKIKSDLDSYLKDLTNNSVKVDKVKYDEYEDSVKELTEWVQYQKILIEVLRQMSDLKYALGLGRISSEECYSLYSECMKEVDIVRNAVTQWHEKHLTSFDIDVDAKRRKRQSLEAVLYKLPGLIKDDLNYKSVEKDTVNMIQEQIDMKKDNVVHIEDRKRYEEDVELIIKDGKVYYLME